MKNRILTFIIGVLTGAIIVTLAFFIYSKSINKNMNQFERMPMNENMQMPPEDWNMEQPPTKPNGNQENI